VRVGFFSAGSGGWGPAVIDAAPKTGRPESGAVALPKRPGEPTTGGAAVCTEHTLVAALIQAGIVSYDLFFKSNVKI
jgi:hypothetical protein